MTNVTRSPDESCSWYCGYPHFSDQISQRLPLKCLGGVGCLAATFSPPGRLAQLGERQLDKLEVTGSSPVAPIPGTSERARPQKRAAGVVPISFAQPDLGEP